MTTKFISMVLMFIFLFGTVSCTTEEKKESRAAIREDIRAILLATAQDDGKKELWQYFLDNKLALMSERLANEASCSPAFVQKLTQDIAPIVPLVKDSINDPNKRKIALLVLSIDELAYKVKQGPLPIPTATCEELLNAIRENLK
jgi:hypothetical protein